MGQLCISLTDAERASAERDFVTFATSSFRAYGELCLSLRVTGHWARGDTAPIAIIPFETRRLSHWSS